MDLRTAQHYADKILAWLSPYCHRLEIAGSIRRKRPQCADVDIVCIPKITEAKDMLGSVMHYSNQCISFLQEYVRTSKSHFISGGEGKGKQVIVQLPKCQLDLWFACDLTIASRLLMRTGSKEHNIWFAERAHDHGLKWFPYFGLAYEKDIQARSGEQLFAADLILPRHTESALYSQLGLEPIAPENREAAWLTQNINSGFPV